MDREKNKLCAASDALKVLACNDDDTMYSKRKIVLQLKKDIVAARSSGKGWNEIVDAIKSAGIDVSGAYIRAVVKEQKRKSAHSKKRRLMKKSRKL